MNHIHKNTAQHIHTKGSKLGERCLKIADQTVGAAGVMLHMTLGAKDKFKSFITTNSNMVNIFLTFLDLRALTSTPLFEIKFKLL